MTFLPITHHSTASTNITHLKNDQKYTVHYRHLVGSHTLRAQNNNNNNNNDNKTTYDIVMLIMTWGDSWDSGTEDDKCNEEAEHTRC